MYTNTRSVFDHARADLDQALSYRCELSLGQRAGLGDGGAHAMHKPERGGVQNKPHLIGGRERVGFDLRFSPICSNHYVLFEVMPSPGPSPGQHLGQQTDDFATALGSSPTRFGWLGAW
jgi:hypothetical protein